MSGPDHVLPSAADTTSPSIGYGTLYSVVEPSRIVPDFKAFPASTASCRAAALGSRHCNSCLTALSLDTPALDHP